MSEDQCLRSIFLIAPVNECISCIRIGEINAIDISSITAKIAIEHVIMHGIFIPV